MTGFIGELAALFTAVLWTITALIFEKATKRVGSLSVNLMRLVFAALLFSGYALYLNGSLLIESMDTSAVLWLILSGIVGFVLGDVCLFESYVLINARIGMLIMSLAPPIAALLGWLFLDEIFTLKYFLGMGLTLSGIVLVILGRGHGRFTFNYPVKGLLLAFGGAVGQAVGLVLSKQGMGHYDPFAASQIRVLAGMAGLALFLSLSRKWGSFKLLLKKTAVLSSIGLGAFTGPFLGVSFSLMAIQYTTTGVASTIMAIVPVLIIPPAVIFFKHHVSLREIVGALIAVMGVMVFFIRF